jgi:hypothetical protein
VRTQPNIIFVAFGMGDLLLFGVVFGILTDILDLGWLVRGGRTFWWVDWAGGRGWCWVAGDCPIVFPMSKLRGGGGAGKGGVGRRDGRIYMPHTHLFHPIIRPLSTAIVTYAPAVFLLRGDCLQYAFDRAGGGVAEKTPRVILNSLPEKKLKPNFSSKRAHHGRLRCLPRGVFAETRDI